LKEIKTVDEYIHELEKELGFMSHKNKKLYLLEVKDHLYSLIEENKKKGFSNEHAEKYAIANFTRPEAIAKQISNDTPGYSKKIKEANNNFYYICSLFLAGTSLLAVPIFKGYINWGLMLAIAIILLPTVVYLIFSKDWNAARITTFVEYTRYFFPIIILGCFSMFLLRSNIDGGINIFSLYYLIFHLILICVIYLVTKKLKSKI